MTSRSFGGHHGLRGHLNSNIHIQMHNRVIKVADFKSEVKLGPQSLPHALLWGYCPLVLPRPLMAVGSSAVLAS